MDGVAEEALGPVQMVEVRHFAEGDEIGDGPGHGFGNGRAAGDIDHRLVGDDVGHRVWPELF